MGKNIPHLHFLGNLKMERKWGGFKDFKSATGRTFFEQIIREEVAHQTAHDKAQRTQQELVQWSSSWDLGPGRPSVLEDS